MKLLILAITANPILNIVIWIVVIALIFYLLWWFIGYVGLPAPFDKVARVLIALVAIVILINFLLGILGSPF